MPNPLAPKKNALWDKTALGLDQPLNMQGRATFLPVQTTNYPSLGDWQWALPGALAGMVNAVTFPSRAVDQAAQGTPYSREQMASEGLNTAMNVGVDSYALSRGMRNSIPPTTDPSIDIGAQVYHGSPHQFDQFDSSKIGTGEGAQAYGHGLYFAEDPTVAKTYQGKVTAMQSKGTPMIGGQPINWDDPVHTAAFEMARHNGDRQAAANFFEQTFAKDSPVPAILRSSQKLPEVQFPGSLYHAEIPDSAISQMLDWDKPMSQQPESVKPVLQAMWKKAQKSFQQLDPDGDPIGGQVYHIYSQHRGGNAAAVSDELKQAGIPGIRYLDAGSRDAATGTRNIVLFDDKLAKITKRE